MQADTIFYNGKIYTMNEARDIATSIAIKDGKIIYVGDDPNAFKTAKTKLYDLEGHLVVPGFIDGHCHPITTCIIQSGCTLFLEENTEAILQNIRSYIQDNPDKKAYLGSGWDDVLLVLDKPNKELLDEICSDKPVLIFSKSFHLALANSKALEVLPPCKSKETGLLTDLKSYLTVIEGNDFLSYDDLTEKLKNISEFYARQGVTSLYDAGVYKYTMDFVQNKMREIVKEDYFKQRYYVCGIACAQKSELEEGFRSALQLKEIDDDDLFRAGTLKILLDGTVESGSAAMVRPIAKGKTRRSLLNEEELTEWGLKCAKAGLNINLHAIGDSASHNVIMMAQKIREAGYDDMRITLSHSQCFLPEDIALMGKYNVIANTTCSWYCGDEEEMENLYDILGYRDMIFFPAKSLIKGGARLGQGSDCPAGTELNMTPLINIAMGQTRQECGKDNLLLPKEERISLDDALASYTINNAYQMGMEDKIGSLEVGKYADMVILDDLFSMSPLIQHEAKIYGTIMNGEIVYNG